MLKLNENAEYKKIEGILKALNESGRIRAMSNKCVAASDMLQHMLSQYGIECKAIECELTLRDELNDAFHFVGFDGGSYPGEIDTHVVVITKTKIPFLIDVSIAHLLPPSAPFIFEPLDTAPGRDNKTLGRFVRDNINLTYTIKQNVRLPAFHQSTLVERLLEDKRIQDNLKFLKFAVMTSIVLSVVNFTLNSVLVVLKIMFP